MDGRMMDGLNKEGTMIMSEIIGHWICSWIYEE